MPAQYKKGDKVTVCYEVIGSTDDKGLTPVRGNNKGSAYYRKFSEFDVVSCVSPIRVGDTVVDKDRVTMTPQTLKVLGINEDTGEIWLRPVQANGTYAPGYRAFSTMLSNYKKV